MKCLLVYSAYLKSRGLVKNAYIPEQRHQTWWGRCAWIFSDRHNMGREKGPIYSEETRKTKAQQAIFAQDALNQVPYARKYKTELVQYKHHAKTFPRKIVGSWAKPLHKELTFIYKHIQDQNHSTESWYPSRSRWERNFSWRITTQLNSYIRI